MIELRWTTPEGTTTKQPTLQWRMSVAVDASGAFCPGAPGAWQDVPTLVVPKLPGGRDFARCTEKLRAQGVAYPRTCAECGLGPCRA